MQIEPPCIEDVEECADCFVAAFQYDPATSFFFPGPWETRKLLIHDFFGLLLKARITLEEPALVIRRKHRILGVAHGYRIVKPTWPSQLSEQWTAVEARQDGNAQRFKVYDAITERYLQPQPHYYLGTLAVHPDAQGKGVGRALVEAFCQLSENDPKSHGTNLDTGNPVNLSFYRKCGFQVLGDGQLDERTTLWCLFRRNERRQENKI